MPKGQSSSQCSMVQRDLKNEKAKTKARHPSRGESPKGMKDFQSTKLGDDQERRTYPFQVAQHKRERVIGQYEEKAVDEDNQESQTSKTCSSYEKKPARTKKYQKNRDSF